MASPPAPGMAAGVSGRFTNLALSRGGQASAVGGNEVVSTPLSPTRRRRRRTSPPTNAVPGYEAAGLRNRPLHLCHLPPTVGGLTAKRPTLPSGFHLASVRLGGKRTFAGRMTSRLSQVTTAGIHSEWFRARRLPRSPETLHPQDLCPNAPRRLYGAVNCGRTI